MNYLVADEWLGQQIKRPAYKLNVDANLLSLKNTELAAGLEPLQTPNAFAYAKLSVQNLVAAHFVQAQGFLLVDTSTTFDKPFTPEQALSGNSHIRFAEASDMHNVVQVAGSSFIYSRFHQDPYMPNETADYLKAKWAENFFHGQRGDAMIVAEIDGQ